MENTEKTLSREKVFESICKSTRVDTLGLFIGSGFSKALLQDNPHKEAYSWKELLEKTADAMGVSKDIFSHGKPYPEIASALCQEYVKNKNCSYKDAERKLKFKIAELVNVSPLTNKIEEYQEVFNRLSPNWIVTTNYDSIIEQILCEKSFPITPKDSYLKTKDFIPVYHIHGSISDPESIVITNEDYTCTLRVSDYRHARLPFLIKESTVLMIGYSFNDLNVLSAVDYSKNIYSNDMPYDTPIIQLLYKENAKKDPYYSENGIIVQEISDLSDYFSEYLIYEKKYRGIIGKVAKKVNDLVEKFSLADDNIVENFIKDNNYRIECIRQVAALEIEFWYVYSSYTAFLNKCFGLLWNRASVYNAFSEYNSIFCVLLDIIENINYSIVPQSFIDYIVGQFETIAYYVSDKFGRSYSASNTWKNRRKNIPNDFVIEYLKRKKDDFDYQEGLRLINQILNKEEE